MWEDLGIVWDEWRNPVGRMWETGSCSVWSMHALMDALDTLRESGTYTLTFETQDGQVVLTLEGRRVTDVTGSWLPDITRFLCRRGIDPLDAALAAHPPGISVGRIMGALLDKGLWTADQAEAAMAAYATGALVPISWEGASVQVADTATESAAGVTAPADTVLANATCWIMAVPRALRHVRPGDRIKALPPRRTGKLRAPSAEFLGIGTGDVYLAMLQGWTLGDVSVNLAVRWDELLSAVKCLMDADLACPPSWIGVPESPLGQGGGAPTLK